MARCDRAERMPRARARANARAAADHGAANCGLDERSGHDRDRARRPASDVAGGLGAVSAAAACVLAARVQRSLVRGLAVALGVSTGAIESLLFRGRSRLRSRLEAVLASLGTPAWLAAVRDLVPRWLDAGGATKVAAATAATVVAGGTFVGERELVHPRHAAPVASSALRSPRPVERAAVIPTPEAAPTARSPGSGPAVVPSSSSGERGPGGGSEGPGSSDSSGKGSSGEGSGEPEGLTSTGETSGASSGSDKGSSGSDGVDSDSSGSGKGGSGPDHD